MTDWYERQRQAAAADGPRRPMPWLVHMVSADGTRRVVRVVALTPDRAVAMLAPDHPPVVHVEPGV